MQDVLHSFSPFGPIHLVMGIAIVAASIGAVRYRRRLASDVQRLQFDRLLAVVALAAAIVNHLSEFFPGRYDLQHSLPLHICDIVGVAGPLAILTRRRVWRTMLYYWGLGLSTQAILTPELQHGLASLSFWVFWLPHTMIVMLALYDLAALGYRPSWKDCLLAVLTLLIYLAVVLPIDLWLNVNYGYVGEGVPGQASVIDFLGPWPQRVFKLVLGVLLLLTLMTLPWVIGRRMTGPKKQGIAMAIL